MEIEKRIELVNGYTPRIDDEGRVLNLEADAVAQHVTVYAVTRCYGGPEEGGWWWNAREQVTSIPLREAGSVEEINSILTFLEGRYEDEGDIYSVRGGVAYDYDFEAVRGEGEVLSSGGYC